MSRATQALLDDALRLTASERADLAALLIESLDAEAEDEGVEASWESEIRTRLEDLDHGKVQTVPWSEARRMILDDGEESARA